jgi:hypothetical protein
MKDLFWFMVPEVSVHHGRENHGGAEKFTSLWPEAREKGIQEDARSKYGPKGLAPTSSH